MIYIGFLHIVLLLSSGLGLLKSFKSSVTPCNLIQYLIFIFALLGKYLDLFPTNDMFNTYILSAFLISLFKENFKFGDGFYIYLTLTFGLFALGLNITLSSVLFSLSSLILTLALFKKNLASLFIGLVSLATVLVNELGLSPLGELLSNALMLGLPFGYYFHNRNADTLRFLLLPLFFLHGSLVVNPLESVWPILILITYLVSIFVTYTDEKEEALNFSLTYFLIFKNLEALDFIAVYLLFYGSLKLLRMTFVEFSKVNFNDGNVEISYQNVIFLLVTTYLFSGTMYTPMSILFGSLPGLDSFLFFGLWIIAVLKSTLSIKQEEQKASVKTFNFIVYTSPVLLFLVHNNLFGVFNPYPLIGFVITILLALLSKKRHTTYKRLIDTVFKLRYHPSLPDIAQTKNYPSENKSYNLKLRGPLIEVRLSFPITVGLLFLFWFLATLSFTKA